MEAYQIPSYTERISFYVAMADTLRKWRSSRPQLIGATQIRKMGGKKDSLERFCFGSSFVYSYARAPRDSIMNVDLIAVCTGSRSNFCLESVMTLGRLARILRDMMGWFPQLVFSGAGVVG